mmetsp:Transcript_19025/g.55228  ORF Transcript_19025/g.55228 Transcript_19025/m.55228 type:complete len:332 (-) Transcript_19025:468-1463(-)
MPRLLDGIVEGTDNVLSLGQSGMIEIGQILGVSLARDGHLISIEQIVVDEEFDHAGRAANVLNVFHDVFSRGLEVGEERGLVGNALKVIQGNGNVGILARPRHGDEMKNGVGRSSRHHDHRNGILEGGLGHDIPRLNILLQQILHGLPGLDALLPLLLRIGGGRRRKRQTHPQGLNGRRHGVGRIHPPARAGSRAGMLKYLLPFVLGDLVVHEFAVRLKGRHDIESFPVGGLLPGPNGPAVNHDGRTIQSRHGHDASRHVLVASRQRDESVVPLSSHGRLDRIGDEIAGLEGEAHALGAHGNAVGHAHGVETISDEVGRGDPLLDRFGQFE